MDLNFSAEEQAFRAEVRAFLSERLSPALSDKVRTHQHLSKEDMEGWHAELNARGARSGSGCDRPNLLSPNNPRTSSWWLTSHASSPAIVRTRTTRCRP